MGYSGSQVNIPLGQLGLLTDDTASALPVNSLSTANNIAFKGGRLSKMFGSLKYNVDTLDAAILAVFDYWPDTTNQRLIAVTDDGSIWRDTGDTTFNSSTPVVTLTNAITTQPHMVTGGNEVTNSNKKLFILTNSNQIQVIDGDAGVTRDVNFPAADFEGGNYPSFAVQYQNKMFVMGSDSDPHRLYASTLSDHENFVGTQFPKSRWQLWSRIAATPDVDRTADIQAGTATTIFTTTNNDGYIVYALKPFNKFTFVISQAATGGAPVYTYEYWNGSAWTALTLTTTPDYSVTGSTSAEFVIPSSWVAGDGTESGTDAYYAIRVLATTHPTVAGKATSLSVFNTNYDALPDTYSIYPGEGEGILCAQEYMGLLFIFKKPYGVYILDGRSPDTAQWSISKYSNAFGVSSPHAVLQILGDLVAANSIGSFTSLKASNAFGDFEAGDILANNKVEDYVRDQLNYAGIGNSHAVYYPEKKLAMWTGASAGDGVMNRILVIDVAAPNPRLSIVTKDMPNCLGLRKDSEGILRPMYGTSDGHVFLFDNSTTYNVDSVPYSGEFQTNDSDLGQIDSQLAGKNKIFDFLEVSYIPTGNNSFLCDVIIDGELRDTKAFDMVLGVELDTFLLDTDSLIGTTGTRRNRLPLYSCTGNKIALRFYNNNDNEGFVVERAILNFRLSGDQLYTNQVS